MYIVHLTFFLKKENIFIVDSNALSIHLLFFFFEEDNILIIHSTEIES